MVKYLIVIPLQLVFLIPFIISGIIYGFLFKPESLTLSELQDYIKEELKWRN